MEYLTGPLLAFLGISVLVIATPGPDTAVTIRNTLLGGRAGGIATASSAGSSGSEPTARRNASPCESGVADGIVALRPGRLLHRMI